MPIISTVAGTFAFGRTLTSSMLQAMFDPYWDNVVLLMHMNGTNNSTIFLDSSEKNDPTPVRGAKISSDQSKFGGASGFFNSGDYVTISSSENFAFGPEDFTIEFWMDLAASAPDQNIISFDGGRDSIAVGASGTSLLYKNDVPVTIVNSISLNSWNHVAVSRISGTVYLFWNGQLVTTRASNYSSDARPLSIGTTSLSTGSIYIDELRITKGIGRYNANFELHTLPFSDQKYTPVGDYIAWGGNFIQLPRIDSTGVIVNEISTDTFTKIAAGTSHTVAIKSNGTLWGWGYNDKWQLSSNSALTVPVPTQIGTDLWLDVASGANHTAAIKNDGTLWAWGQGTSGQLGDGKSTTSSSPVQITTKFDYSGRWKYVACDTSEPSTHLIDNNNFLYITGAQLKYNSNSVRSSPSQIGTSSWKKISFAKATIAAIDSNNNLYIWGDGYFGQLGNNTNGASAYRNSPALLDTGGVQQWLDVATGQQHILAIRSDGTLWGWGSNAFNQLGSEFIASDIQRLAPAQIGKDSWIMIDAGDTSSYGIKSDGTLWAWGDNTSGQLAQNIEPSVRHPKPAQVGNNYIKKVWQKVFGAYTTAMAIDADGYLHMWGETGGVLYPTIYGQIFAPLKMSEYGTWRILTGGRTTALGIRSDGTLWAWGGFTGNYSLGVGDTTPRSQPTQVGSDVWNHVSSEGHTVAIRSDGTLWTWGLNSSGELGDGTRTNRLLPLQIGTDTWQTAVVSRSDSARFTFAVRSDGTLWAWGTGSYLGLPTNVSRSSPVQVGTDTWYQVAAGEYHTLAIRSDGTLWGWGSNAYGKIGNGLTAGFTSQPALISSGSWAKVTVGRGCSAAIASDGTLWVWGYNFQGQLGLGNTATKSFPTQLGLEQWLDIAILSGTISESMTAVKSDGTLWAWGAAYYALGDGTRSNNRSSPVFIGGQIATDNKTFNWVSATHRHALIIDTEGLLYSSGLNNAGQLGTDDIINRSALVQIGTDATWKTCSAGRSHSVAVRTDNYVFTCGSNIYGQLGTEDRIDRKTLSAAQVTRAGTVLSMSFDGSFYDAAGHSFTVANALISTNFSRFGSSSFTSGPQAGKITSASNDFILKDEQFTIEFWLYLDGSAFTSTLSNSNLVLLSVGGNDYDLRIFGLYNTNSVGFGPGTPTVSLLTASVEPNSWTHLVLTRNDVSEYKFWINGNLVGRVKNISVNTFTGTVIVGGRYNSSNAGCRNAYISNLQIVKGKEIYTNEFAPPDAPTSTVPATVEQLTGKQVSAGYQHTAVIDATGVLYTFGAGSIGATGISSTRARSTPAIIPGTPVPDYTDQYQRVFAAGNSTYAIRSDGMLWAWGNNSAGQLGDGTILQRPAPVKVNSLQRWVAFAPGEQHVAAVSTNNTLWSWGRNAEGQLGFGDNNNRSIPAQVGTATWKKVASGENYTLAISSDNKLYATGINNAGQLGVGDTISRSSLTQIGSSDWKDVYAGVATTGGSYALSQNNILHAWGNGFATSLPSGSTINRSQPTQLGTATWNSFVPAATHAIGLKANGKLATFGVGDAVLLGESIITPKKWLQSNSWVMLSAGSDFMVGIKSDGTLWSWGKNTHGQLGNDSILSTASPVLVSAKIGQALDSYTGPGTLSLLMHMDGSNGSVNFVDSSAKNIPVASESGATLSTAQSKFGGASAAFTTNDPTKYVLIPSTQELEFGTGDFTIECWVYLSAARYSDNGYPYILHMVAETANQQPQIELYKWRSGLSNQWGMDIILPNSGYTRIETTTPPAADMWHHVAITRASSTVRLFIDGQLIGSISDTTNFPTSKLYIGNSPLNNFLPGRVDYIDELRIIKGHAVYTAGFTAPTSPFFSSTGSTVALYHLNNNLTSDSGGSDIVAPVAPTYVTGKFGQALRGFNQQTAENQPYFSTVSFGTGDFTVEFWVCLLSLPSTPWVLNTIFSLGTYGTNDISFGIWKDGYSAVSMTGSTSGNTDLGVAVVGGSNNPAAFYNLLLNTWTHVALTRSSGTINFFVNGALIASWSETRSLGTNLGYLFKTSSNTGTYGSWNASVVAIDEIRIIKGAAAYNAPFTAPTTEFSTTQTSAITWSSVSAGESHVMALSSSGQLWTWGHNGYGQLGIGTTANRSTPVLLGNDWKSISAGGNYCTAINSTGRLYAWGLNSSGELGDGSTISRSRPAQIGSAEWSQVSAGYFHTLAIAADNTLWSWGNNTTGQLGLNDRVSRNSPVRVSTGAWKTVSAGLTHSLAISATNKLFAWGQGSDGQLGDGTPTTRSSPVQIGTSNWKRVHAANYLSFGIRFDNSLWAWGKNDTGQMGDGTKINRSSPVKIGTEQWASVVGKTNFAGIVLVPPPADE